MGHLHLPHPVGAARTHSPVREQRRIRPSTARDTAHSRSHVTAQLPSATGSSCLPWRGSLLSPTRERCARRRLAPIPTSCAAARPIGCLCRSSIPGPCVRLECRGL